MGNNFEEYHTSSVNDITNQSDIIAEIGTVHSSKGQTHCATMYVETSYYSYESEKLKSPNPLIGDKHNYLNPNIKNISRAIETLKMMYVGFSRPTHLLCFASF